MWSIWNYLCITAENYKCYIKRKGSTIEIQLKEPIAVGHMTSIEGNRRPAVGSAIVQQK